MIHRTRQVESSKAFGSAGHSKLGKMEMQARGTILPWEPAVLGWTSLSGHISYRAIAVILRDDG